MMSTIVKLLCIAGFFVWPTTSSETLTNTKWSGTFNVPGPMDGSLEFKKDTVYLSIGENVVETMTFQEKGDTILLQKIDGSSPCNDEMGEYKVQVNKNTLIITAIKDDCSMRAGAFSKEGYIKE